MTVIDDYLKGVKPAECAELERLRQITRQAVPEAEEVITYGMPAW